MDKLDRDLIDAAQAYVIAEVRYQKSLREFLMQMPPEDALALLRQLTEMLHLHRQEIERK